MVKVYNFLGVGLSSHGADFDLAKKIKFLEENEKVNFSDVRSEKEFWAVYQPDHDLVNYDVDDIHEFVGKDWKEVKIKAAFKLNLNYSPVYYIREKFFV